MALQGRSLSPHQSIEYIYNIRKHFYSKRDKVCKEMSFFSVENMNRIYVSQLNMKAHVGKKKKKKGKRMNRCSINCNTMELRQSHLHFYPFLMTVCFNIRNIAMLINTVVKAKPTKTWQQHLQHLYILWLKSFHKPSSCFRSSVLTRNKARSLPDNILTPSGVDCGSHRVCF